MTAPRVCPRWEGCVAPVCPLATDWERHRHLDGERVCGLLCELAKEGGEARLRGVLSAVLVDRLAEVAPAIASRWYPIRKRLQRASRTGSRVASGQRLARHNGGSVEDATVALGKPPATSARVTVPPVPASCGAIR